MEDRELGNRLLKAFNAIPFNQTLGLKMEFIEKNHVRMSFQMNKHLIGNIVYGILHGGVTASVLDMAGGMVSMVDIVNKFGNLPFEELAAKITKCSTINLQINFVNPGKGNQFFADAWLVKVGTKISFTNMELTNEDNLLIATASGTYLIK